MIVLIPVIAVLAALFVGAILYYGYAVMEVADLREGASVNHQSKVAETMYGEYEGGPGDLKRVRIFSEWPQPTNVVGLMVECSDGKTALTMAVENVTVRSGDDFEMSSQMRADMKALALNCP